jgi:hypothetical protein
VRAEGATGPGSPPIAPVYVYGVVRRGALSDTRGEGIRGAPLELLERDRLAVLVSSLPEDGLRVRRQDLLRHLRLLEEVFAETTVVPCAFGTVVSSREAAEEHLLVERRDELNALIERLEGRVQMNVKIAYDEDRVLAEIVDAEPEIARLREATRRRGDAAYYDNIRLGELIAAALAARRAHDADRFVHRLADHAEEAVVDDSTDETLVLKASFLLSAKRLNDFNAELDALAASEAPRIRLEAIGPLPPTAFASLGAEV